MAIHGHRAAARCIAAPSARNDGGGGNTGPGGQFVLFVIARSVATWQSMDTALPPDGLPRLRLAMTVVGGIPASVGSLYFSSL